ncbi:MAG: hypothetical protein ABH851_05865 [Methanobacteriota archaeon]
MISLMDKLVNLLSRIRWASVLGLFLVITLIVVLIMAIPSSFSFKGDIGVSISADPSTIKMGEHTTVEIEVKNKNANQEVEVNVEVKTYDKNFVFTESTDSKVSRGNILIGPRESRKLSFEVRPASGALAGKYRVDVVAREKSYAEGAQDSVTVKVVKD